MRYIFLISLILISCSRKNSYPGKSLSGVTDFARSFQIQAGKDYTRIDVLYPWQKAENVNFTYILSSGLPSLPDSLELFQLIKIPVGRVVAMSTTHIGFISALGKAGSIVGVSGDELVNDSIVRKSLKDHSCYDIGYYPNLNYEGILELKPDVVFLYGTDASVQNVAYRLKEVGIPAVFVSEFLEDHPLGKSEWIKFFAVFYACPEEGENIFNNVRDHYIALRDSIKQVTNKPKVLAGLPWKDTWFLPGGKSFSAQLINDAGGDYLWKNDHSVEFIALDLETVFIKAVDADIWINTGSAVLKTEILANDKRFGVIKAFRSDSVYNNNLKLSPAGGNDFWESGVVRQDIILRDLIEIMHPGFLSEHLLYYYRKLE